MPPGFINEMRPGVRVIAMFRAGASLQRSVWLHGTPSVEELRKAGCISDFVSHTLLTVDLSSPLHEGTLPGGWGWGWGRVHCVAPFIFKVGFSWRVVANIALPPKKRYTLNRSLGGPHSRSGHFGEEISLFPLEWEL